MLSVLQAPVPLPPHQLGWSSQAPKAPPVRLLLLRLGHWSKTRLYRTRRWNALHQSLVLHPAPANKGEPVRVELRSGKARKLVRPPLLEVFKRWLLLLSSQVRWSKAKPETDCVAGAELGAVHRNCR